MVTDEISWWFCLYHSGIDDEPVHTKFLPFGSARVEGGISFSIRDAKSNCLNWKFLNFENGFSEKDSKPTMIALIF